MHKTVNVTVIETLRVRREMTKNDNPANGNNKKELKIGAWRRRVGTPDNANSAS